jgi:type IV secretion system protein VirB6
MDNFLGDLIERIDASGQNFSQRAFEVLSREIEPLARILVALLVVFYGAQLITGTARIGVADMTGRVVRTFVILILIGSWPNFAELFYNWLTTVPEAAGRAILAASATGVNEPTDGLSQIWETANVASATFSEQAGYLSVLPALIGIVIMIFAGFFVAIALGILVLAKVVLWVLLGTAPIFIACAFFNPTRNYAIGWVNQALLYALIPLFVYVIAAFLIAAMAPELTKINQISGDRELTLSDFAAFIMLCIAGSFVLIQIQSLAQGIVGAFATAVGEMSRRVGARGLFISRASIGVSATQTQAAVQRLQARLSAPNPQAQVTMQRAIAANGALK